MANIVVEFWSFLLCIIHYDKKTFIHTKNSPHQLESPDWAGGHSGQAVVFQLRPLVDTSVHIICILEYWESSSSLPLQHWWTLSYRTYKIKVSQEPPGGHKLPWPMLWAVWTAAAVTSRAAASVEPVSMLLKLKSNCPCPSRPTCKETKRVQRQIMMKKKDNDEQLMLLNKHNRFVYLFYVQIMLQSVSEKKMCVYLCEFELWVWRCIRSKNVDEARFFSFGFCLKKKHSSLRDE